MRVGKTAKPQRKKKNIFLRVACAAFAVYVVVQVVSLQIQLHSKREELAANEAEIRRIELQNESNQEKLNNSDIQMEEEARDNGCVKDGEQIFYLIPGE